MNQFINIFLHSADIILNRIKVAFEMIDIGNE